MTYYDFLKKATARYDNGKYLRCGQALYITLVKESPELASKVFNSNIDPFYDDMLIPTFLLFVKSELK